MVSRAQVSLEFLMITAVAMVLMTATSFFLFDYTQSKTDQNALQQSAQVGYRLVDQATNMYVYGDGSFVSVQANMPDGIDKIYTVENDTLVLEVITSNGPVPVQVFSTVPINGTQADAEKTHVNPAGSSVHPGNTGFRVTSHGSWVEIRQET